MIDKFNKLLIILEKSNLEPSIKHEITLLRKEIEEDELAVRHYPPFTKDNPLPGHPSYRSPIRESSEDEE